MNGIRRYDYEFTGGDGQRRFARTRAAGEGSPAPAGEAGAKRPSVTAIIPTLNEAANLPHVLPALPSIITEVVIVDGHSTDGTRDVARAVCPEARIVLQNAKGKGNALACGFAVATGDIIVMLDSDGSTDPAEITAFVEALVAGADFAKGSRYMRRGGSEDLTLLRRLGNTGLTFLVNRLFRVRYTDLCYGYIAFWRRCLPQLSVDCRGFEVETLLNIRAAKARLTIAEVPSVEKNRIHGESNLHPVRDGIRILRTIVRERLSAERGVGGLAPWAALSGQLDVIEGPAAPAAHLNGVEAAERPTAIAV